VFAVRITYTGELGWEFYIPRQSAQSVYKSLLSAGEEHGIGHFGTFALDALRIEKGFKMWGNEMNLDVDALEAGLKMFIRDKFHQFLPNGMITLDEIGNYILY
jgi:glycine cleavage system aminomethyltransferase T